MKPHGLISLALIAQLLAAPVTTGVFILCYGSDGHVAVESAGESDCCRAWKVTHHGVPGGEGALAAIEPSSGPCCTDLALSIDPAMLTGCSQKFLPAVTSAAGGSGMTSSLRAGPAAPLPLPTESSVAASLRTVVLRA
jgi:hypothetical protein